MSKYIYWVKKDLFGCFRQRRTRRCQCNKFERRRSNKNRNYSASITRCSLSSLCIYLPSLSFSIFVEGDERIVVFIFVLLVLLGGDKSGNLLSTFFNNKWGCCGGDVNLNNSSSNFFSRGDLILLPPLCNLDSRICSCNLWILRDNCVSVNKMKKSIFLEE